MHYLMQIASLWICLVSVSIACPGNQTVPFQNVVLAPNCSFNANYNFGAHAIIFCYTNTDQNAGTITWPYLGQQLVSNIPIFLKTNVKFQGEFADASGTLTITNNVSSNLTVNCLFGF